MNRAYSVIQIKEVRDGTRVIRGMATTPEVDRVGDVIDPLGVESAQDIPLFLYHDSTKTVGRAKLGKATKDGVPFEAYLPVVQEEGSLRSRVEEAWQMLKYRLITGVSIGFNVIDNAYEVMKNGGYHFLKTEVLELSLVPVPANASATVDAIKSLCDQHLAALGRKGADPRPGASGHKAAGNGHSTSRSQKGGTMKTLTELREMRQTKTARMKELVDLFQTADHEATDDENAEFDTLKTEVKHLDIDIRVAEFHATNAAGAKGVDGSSAAAAAASRGGLSFVKKTDPDDKFKGQSYTRLLRAKALAFMQMKGGNFVTPAQIAEQLWGKTHPNLVGWIKAAVAGGGTGSGEWGAELAQSDTRYTGDFVEFLYSMAVFDRLPLREIPARVHVKGQDGAATGYWVGESKAIPASKADFSDVELTPLKVGALAVCSKELIADSSPSAELWIRDSIAQASAQRVDTTFLSAAAASAGVSPAGILNGLSAYAPSGTDADAVRADLMSLYTGFLTAKNASGLVQIMTPSMAKALQLLRNSLGQREFPDIRADGGTLEGDTVYTGDNVTPGDWILLKPSDIWKIGDGGVDVSMSDQATIEMNDAPAGASDTPVDMASHRVSMFQTESVAFKVVRRINFAKRRSSAVAYLADAEYGGVVS